MSELTFEIIEGVNNEMHLIDFKGNNYAEVKERVKAFRKIFPLGRIETSIIEKNENSVTIKATVKDDEGNIIATGHASETKGDGYINKTSHLENCETSAVGRALGFFGLGIESAICSIDELRNKSEEAEAEKRYEEEGKEIIEEKYVKALRTKLANGHVEEAEVCKLFEIKSIEELNYKQFRYINDNFAKMVEAVKNGNKSET